MVRRSAYDAVSSPSFFGTSHVVVVTVFPPLSFFSVSLNHEALMPQILANCNAPRAVIAWPNMPSQQFKSPYERHTALESTLQSTCVKLWVKDDQSKIICNSRGVRDWTFILSTETLWQVRVLSFDFNGTNFMMPYKFFQMILPGTETYSANVLDISSQPRSYNRKPGGCYNHHVGYPTYISSCPTVVANCLPRYETSSV